MPLGLRIPVSQHQPKSGTTVSENNGSFQEPLGAIQSIHHDETFTLNSCLAVRELEDETANR
jgi:hypothetical protein